MRWRGKNEGFNYEGWSVVGMIVSLKLEGGWKKGVGIIWGVRGRCM
jgi:hypothetical protein